ncbi:deoxyribodipyrimidine photolyase [Rhodovulum sp. 12E13]|uniref:FAD-binding domain-containing protein n=1 Tax=Rhodovulum sp. 12E13 TaxID=2203891 RepID=UPI000E131CEC|nr:FAD-binding domain-containing protein [Rhodovulum sp. 12E13]RDC71177.1 deoxyribodipyrimidine photolyase [Rhodovulum sp. 12E13]
MTILLWFKRDLRVQDHPALSHAAALSAETGAAVLPVCIVEPAYWRLPDTSARQWGFTAECLAGLRKALARLGLPLAIRVGDAVEELAVLSKAHGATRLVSHEETGNGWTYARDRRVAAWAREAGLPWDELGQSGVVRRLASRDGWAGRRERWLRQPRLAPPGGLPTPGGVEPGRLPSAADLGLAPDPCPGRQAGGRAEAERLLESFLAERGRTYRKDMSSPLTGERACSRLSPHLALGTLSVREAHQAALARKQAAQGRRDGWAGALASFASRLAWRDHFMQKLEDQPDIEHACLHPAYEGLRPAEPEPARLAAWQRGETGLPFVDACMRYLAATGWLNFRMRSMLMAVASYHLWLDWRATGPHLARLFTDYEPGIHWSQVQMQSGTTGMNTVRIYNPVKQGHDQDPSGAFIRAWVPELSEVPDRYLQEPWLWEGAGRLLGRAYPAPLVDVKAAAKAASAKVWGVRKGAAFRAEADRIVTRHASRKEAGVPMRFRRDPEPRPPQRTPDQLKLDL